MDELRPARAGEAAVTEHREKMPLETVGGKNRCTCGAGGWWTTHHTAGRGSWRRWHCTAEAGERKRLRGDQGRLL